MFKKNKGFTLIELLVVIAIIGTLSGIVLVSLGGARSKARDATRQSDMRQVISAQEMYYDDQSAYLTADGTATGTPAITGYLRALDDPLGTTPYEWIANNVALTCTDTAYSAAEGQWYCGYATLENLGSCSTAQYMVTSHHGTLIVCDTAPTATGTCTCFH